MEGADWSGKSKTPGKGIDLLRVVKEELFLAAGSLGWGALGCSEGL